MLCTITVSAIILLNYDRVLVVMLLLLNDAIEPKKRDKCLLEKNDEDQTVAAKLSLGMCIDTAHLTVCLLRKDTQMSNEVASALAEADLGSFMLINNWRQTSVSTVFWSLPKLH